MPYLNSPGNTGPRVFPHNFAIDYRSLSVPDVNDFNGSELSLQHSSRRRWTWRSRKQSRIHCYQVYAALNRGFDWSVGKVESDFYRLANLEDSLPLWSVIPVLVYFRCPSGGFCSLAIRRLIAVLWLSWSPWWWWWKTRTLEVIEEAYG